MSFTAEPEEWNDHQLSFEKNERVAMDTNRGGLCDGLLTPTPGEIPFAINTHFGVKGLICIGSSSLRGHAVCIQPTQS